jgi:hypothetical protein
MDEALAHARAAGKTAKAYPMAIASLERDTALAIIGNVVRYHLVDAVVLDLPLYFNRPSRGGDPGNRYRHLDEHCSYTSFAIRSCA